jgi:hypothetical protein
LTSLWLLLTGPWLLLTGVRPLLAAPGLLLAALGLPLAALWFLLTALLVAAALSVRERGNEQRNQGNSDQPFHAHYSVGDAARLPTARGECSGAVQGETKSRRQTAALSNQRSGIRPITPSPPHLQRPGRFR